MKVKIPSYEVEVDWSNWLVGVAVDRYYNYFNDSMNTDIYLHVGPFCLSLYL